MKSQHHTIEVPEDHTLVVRKNVKNNFGKFQAIGPMRTMDSKEEDIFDLLAQVSKSAFQLFNQIKLTRDPETNICVTRIEFNSASQKAAFSRSFNELKRKDIIKRVKAAYYKKDKNEQAFILNPDLFKTFNINKAQEIWFNC
ncbi:MAG: hypothetical protein ACRBB6_04100 [Neptuniibacter sp.]